jgi:hypothetical protein
LAALEGFAPATLNRAQKRKGVVLRTARPHWPIWGRGIFGPPVGYWPEAPTLRACSRMRFAARLTPPTARRCVPRIGRAFGTCAPSKTGEAFCSDFAGGRRERGTGERPAETQKFAIAGGVTPVCNLAEPVFAPEGQPERGPVLPCRVGRNDGIRPVGTRGGPAGRRGLEGPSRPTHPPLPSRD